MYIKYTHSGHIYISPEDDCEAVVDAMLITDYSEEFCIAIDFTPEFVSKLMKAGFLVMSANMAEEDEDPFYITLPKLHVVRSVLFFENLHIKKSIRRFLGKYELRPNAEFDRIIDRCIKEHGDDWLTPPLIDCIKKIRNSSVCGGEELAIAPADKVFPVSFGLYRDGNLVAGEFGVVCGKVYSSYSGYHDEDNSGTVQIILAAQYLQKQGFNFLDFGMPLDYKTMLGAQDVDQNEFIRLFRS